jgi:hypothetical protein
MIEKYLEKNYSIKNNKIVNKRFVEEIDFIHLVTYVTKIFSISESDGFNYVFNFTKKYGYDLKGDYAYFDGNFIKIDEFHITTKVEELERIFNERRMGVRKTEIEFKITHEHSKNIITNKSNESFNSYSAVAPIRYYMYFKGFYYSHIMINSMDINNFMVHIKADVGFFQPGFKDELKSF